MFYKEMVERFTAAGAESIVQHKRSEPDLAEKEIRYFPDAPQSEERVCCFHSWSLGA